MKLSKIILLCCVVFIISCRKVEVIPQPQPINKDVFAKSEVSVSDGQDIQFSLTSTGKYTLTLFDSTTNQVISKERFTGIIGDNIKKIYTKSLSQKSLYLYLTDESNNKIKQTKITIN
jgi:hypothetical protein